MATWGGVGCNECVVFITADETYMRPKYTNPIFPKGNDSPLSVTTTYLSEGYVVTYLQCCVSMD